MFSSTRHLLNSLSLARVVRQVPLEQGHLLFGLSLNINVFFNYTSSVPQNISEEFKLCNIQDSDFYKSLSEAKEQSVMDKVVSHIMKENIQVHQLALNNNKIVKTKAFVTFRRQASSNFIPPEFKIGRYSPKDEERILANFSKLLKDANLEEKSKALKKEILEKPDEDFHFPWKMNVLGLYLSQGLQDLRLPCDVSNKLRNSLLNNDRKPYTQEEDDIIRNFMLENSGSPNPFSDLAVILGRSREGVTRRYKQYIRDGKPSIRGRFTIAEDRRIMTKVFKQDRNAHHSNAPLGQKFWHSLSSEMGRHQEVCRNRWNHVIAPTIVMYERGVLELDFTELLLDYCVENGIKYTKEANWTEISRLPQFHGLSSSYLSYIYSWNRNNTRQALSHLAAAEVTSEVILNHYDTKMKRNKKTALENPQTLDIIDHYNQIKMTR